MKRFEKILLLSLTLIATLLCFKGNTDPDLYWHMATGRWILENLQFPTQDTFSFVYNGAAWINLPWLFQIGSYLSALALDHLGVLIFCAFFYVISVLFSWWSFRQLSLSSPNIFSWFFCLGLFFLLEQRWVPRPETATHLFLSIEIFILLKFCLNPNQTRILWLLPLLQIFWVNSHGMFILGPIFIGFVMLRFPRQLWKPFILSILAVLVNPYGWKGALYPFYLRQISADPLYRLIREGLAFGDQGVHFNWYVSWACWLVLLALSLNVGRRVLGWVYFLWIGFAIYFSTTMVRNLSPAVLITAPFILAGVTEIAEKFFKQRKEFSYLYQSIFVSVATIVFTILIFRGQMDFIRDDFHFGWKVSENDDLQPAGDFLEKNKIKDKMFTTPEFGNYMLWRNPEFKSFIDTRYAEVVPRSHFEKMFRLFLNPKDLEAETMKYALPVLAFNHTLRNYHGAIRYFLSSENWRIIYLDHFLVFFVRKDYRPDLLTLKKNQLIDFLNEEVSRWLQDPLSRESQKNRVYQVLVAAALFGQEGVVLEKMKTFEDKMDLRFKNMYCSILTYSTRSPAISLTEQKTNAEKASHVCEEVFNRTGEDSSAYNRAAADVGLKNYSSALEWIGRALKLSPQSYSYYLLKVEILKHLDFNHYSLEIENCYQQSLQLNPFQEKVWIELLVFQKSKGELEKMKTTLKIAQQFYPQMKD